MGVDFSLGVEWFVDMLWRRLWNISLFNLPGRALSDVL